VKVRVREDRREKREGRKKRIKRARISKNGNHQRMRGGHRMTSCMDRQAQRKEVDEE
jgi:hypothetical protein